MSQASINTEYQVQATLDLLPAFDVRALPYKYVNNQPINTHILIPRAGSNGKMPTFLRFHGGGFCEGASDYWLRPWTLELALKHNAVVVAPDYRLCPETEFEDVMTDMADFLKWVELGSLQGLFPDLDIDVSDLAIVGESAGGYLAAQAALMGFSKKARVVILQYPFLNAKVEFDLIEKIPESAKIPLSVLEDHLANSPPGQILTRTPNGTRMHLLAVQLQHGRMINLDKSPMLDPMRSLEAAEHIPPIFLFHGLQDSVIRVEGIQAWAEHFRSLRPEVPIYTSFVPGEHVLDEKVTLQTAWLKEPIEFVERYWPSRH